MRSAVTGGAGFIGSHLVEHLLAQGDEVVILDDLSTGSPANLGGLLGDDRVEFVQGSVLDPVLVERVAGATDRVFHLAAAVGVKLIVERPLSSLRTNVRGTENVLEAVHQTGSELLLASTSEVYGKNTADALAEDADRILGSPFVSRWSYAAAKGIDESFAHGYWREYGTRVTTVRLFNTVGPRQTGRYGMVLPNLVSQALRGAPLTVFGDGLQTRCFSSVGDVVPAMVRMIEEPRAVGRAVNLGGAEEVRIVDLAQRVIDVLGSSSRIEFVPYDLAYGDGYEDMRRRVPDNGLARKLVGFDPATTLEDMILGVAAPMVAGGAADDTMAFAGVSPGDLAAGGLAAPLPDRPLASSLFGVEESPTGSAA